MHEEKMELRYCLLGMALHFGARKRDISKTGVCFQAMSIFVWYASETYACSVYDIYESEEDSNEWHIFVQVPLCSA
jgi:hypothetical protein